VDDDADRRAWLLRRIEVEARACVNAEYNRRQMIYGRVLGLLEAGVGFGFWSKKAENATADAVLYGYRVRKAITRLAATVRLLIMRDAPRLGERST
jgi:hypothetical protein